MSQQVIQINMDFPAPVDTVFALFENHEKLGMILGAKIKRIKEGKDTPNGLGSVRKLRVGPLPPIEETVMAYRKNELIEYTISNKAPLKNHYGTMKFSDNNGVTSLDYNIVFESAIPLVGELIRKGLEATIRKGCNKYVKSLG